MHALLFSLKRTHQSSLAWCRSLTRPFPGLTPARFDMLHAIDHHGGLCFTQSKLRRLLGVARATVSRMAKSLEELGLITRTRSEFDRRDLEIALTKEGAALFKDADDLAIGSGAIEFLVTQALAFHWYSESAMSSLMAFDEYMYVARDRLHDTATLRYVWHPEDCCEQ